MTTVLLSQGVVSTLCASCGVAAHRYNIRLSLWAFDYEHPVAVTGQCHEWVNGVPTDFSAIIEFSGGRYSSTLLYPMSTLSSLANRPHQVCLLLHLLQHLLPSMG